MNKHLKIILGLMLIILPIGIGFYMAYTYDPEAFIWLVAYLVKCFIILALVICGVSILISAK